MKRNRKRQDRKILKRDKKYEENKENQQKSHDSKYTSNCISRNKEKRIKAYEQQVERTEPRKKKYVHIDSDPSTNKKSKHVSFLTDCNDCLINEIFYIDYDHSKSQEIFHSDRNRNEIESLHIVKGTNDVYRNELDGDSDDETLKEEEEKKYNYLGKVFFQEALGDDPHDQHSYDGGDARRKADGREAAQPRRGLHEEQGEEKHEEKG